jgi:DNA polymerase-3 subunit delta
VLYIFHGEDEFSRAEALARLRGQLAGGDPAMADLNTIILDGSRVTIGELRHACDTIPFMADRRLVIVHRLLRRLVPSNQNRDQKPTQVEEPAWKRAFLEELLAYLPALPPTTRLIFIEDKALSGSHPVVKLAQADAMKGRGFVKLYKRPKDTALPAWIQQRARVKGGELSLEATTMLAALVGDDLRLLDQEIEKLLLYADGRAVNTEDVRTLVSRAREASIFDLVDCVGRRQTDQALVLLHLLLDDNVRPLYLLAMLARQVRILIQVSELQEQGLSQTEITGRLKLHPFVVKKGVAQAPNFSIAQLEAAHQSLVETDWLIKTGRIEEVLALDTLIVNLTNL